MELRNEPRCGIQVMNLLTLDVFITKFFFRSQCDVPEEKDDDTNIRVATYEKKHKKVSVLYF